VTLSISLGVGGDVKTRCAARVALPVAADDNPWRRRAEAWRP